MIIQENAEMGALCSKEQEWRHSDTTHICISSVDVNDDMGIFPLQTKTVNTWSHAQAARQFVGRIGGIKLKLIYIKKIC